MPTQAEIQQFYQQNANNPDALRAAMAQYGVTPDQAAQATGQNANTFSNLGLNTGNGFYGNNGQLYANQLGQGQTSFTASNGQTLDQKQIQDWYAKNGQTPGADQAMMTQLGLKAPDLYKARQLAGQGAGTGIWTDPKEMDVYGQYLKGQQTSQGLKPGAMAFDQWRSAQDPTYLSGLQTGGGGQMNSGTNLGMGMGGGGNVQNANGYGASNSGGGGTNPYLQGMGQTIIDQMTENYTRNQLPASRSGAMAVGGFGGSRQGVIEANGLNDLNRGIGQNLTNLYGQDWTNQQNRNLQNKSIDNQYDLGIKSNNLGFANLDSNNQQFGANHTLNLLNAQNNWAQQGVQNANGIQNTPIDYSRYFQGQTNQTAGQGGTNTNTQTNPGNPYIGALGGAQLINSWFKG